jgi:MFS family permease
MHRARIQTQATRGPGAFRGPAWYPVALLFACYLLSNIDRLMISLLIEPIKATFRMTDAQIGFLQGTAFYLAWPLAGLPLARLADRGNRPRIVGLCVIAWSLATGACGFATSRIGLCVARAGVAVGESGLLPATFSYMPDIYTGRAVVRANAVFMSAAYLGGGLALVFGGTLYASVQDWHLAGTPLASLAPWQLVFVFVGLPGLVLGPLVWLTLREPPDIDRIRPPQPHGLRDCIRYMIERRAWQGPYLGVICANALLTATNLAWVPAMLSRNFGLRERALGLAYGPVYMAAGLIGAGAAAALVGRAGADDQARLRRILHVLMIASLVMVAPAVFAPLATSLPLALALLAICIALFSGILVLATSIGQIVFPSGMRAQASTLVSMVNVLIGASAGPLLVGVISDALPLGHHSLAAAIAIVTAAVVPLMAVSVGGMQRALRRDPAVALPVSFNDGVIR